MTCDCPIVQERLERPSHVVRTSLSRPAYMKPYLATLEAPVEVTYQSWAPAVETVAE